MTPIVNSALPRIGSLISLFGLSWINCLDILVMVAFEEADVVNVEDVDVVSVMLGVSLLHRFALLQWQTFPSSSMVSFHVTVSFLHNLLNMMGSI